MKKINSLLVLFLLYSVFAFGCTEEKQLQGNPKNGFFPGNDFNNRDMNNDFFFNNIKKELNLPEDATKEEVLEEMRTELDLPEEATEQEIMDAWRQENIENFNRGVINE